MFLLKNEKGAALPLVLIVMIVLTLLGTALWHYGVNELSHSEREEKRARAYYLARAGAESLARDLMINPEKIESLIPSPGNVQTLSEYDTEIDFETEYSGEVGIIDVELERVDSDTIKITGTGTVEEISENVSILMEMHGLFDGVLYAESDLDFASGTNVDGDIYTAGEVSGGNINGDIYEGQSFNFTSVSFPPNIDYPDYPSYPLEDGDRYVDDSFHPPDKTIFRITGDETLYNEENPEDKRLAYETIDIRNNGSLTIDASNNPVNVRAETILMNDKLRLQTKEGNRLRIFTNNIILDDFKVRGDGIAEIFVYGDESKINIQTKHASVVDPNANLIFYLDDGCEMEFQAHGSFESLVYGPGAYIRMQSGTFEGSMIAHEVTGRTESNVIRTDLTHREDYCWDLADIDLGYVMVHWLR